MGKIDQQPETVIHHFSHSHPLHLSHHHPQPTLNLASCAGCKLEVTGFIYNCKPCNYFLHVSCSRMSQQITHQFHSAHPLSLFPKPAYPEGLFNCDACGKRGDGFSYHCGVCNIDLHILCALKPLIINHLSHHHQLALLFSPPYDNKRFSCDICGQIGSDHWLYRCQECEFDAHLSCATAKPSAAPIQTTSRAPANHGHFPGNQSAIGQNYTQPSQFPSGQRSYINMPTSIPFHSPGTQLGIGQNHPVPLMNQVNDLNPARLYGPATLARISGFRSSFLSQAVDGLVNSAAQQLGGSLVLGLQGGSGGGGDGGGGTWDGGSSSVSNDYDSGTGTDGGLIDFLDIS